MGERVEIQPGKKVAPQRPSSVTPDQPKTKSTTLRLKKVSFTSSKKRIDGKTPNPTAFYNKNALIPQGAAISKQTARTAELLRQIQALLPAVLTPDVTEDCRLTLPNSFTPGELLLTDIAKALKAKYGFSAGIATITQSLKAENPEAAEALTPGQTLKLSKTLTALQEKAPEPSLNTPLESLPKELPVETPLKPEAIAPKESASPETTADKMPLPNILLQPTDLSNLPESSAPLPPALSLPETSLPAPPKPPEKEPNVPPKALPHRHATGTGHRKPSPLPKAAGTPSVSPPSERKPPAIPQKALPSAAPNTPVAVSAEDLKSRQYQLVKLQEANQPLLQRFQKFAYQQADAQGQKFNLAQLGGDTRYQNYRAYLTAATQNYHEGYSRLQALAKNNNLSNADFQTEAAKLQKITTTVGHVLYNYEHKEVTDKNPTWEAQKNGYQAVSIHDPKSVPPASLEAPPPPLTPKQIIHHQKAEINAIQAQHEQRMSQQGWLDTLWDGAKKHSFSEYNADGQERSRLDPRKWVAQIVSYDVSSAAVNQHLHASKQAVQKLEATERVLAEAEATHPDAVNQHIEKFNHQLEATGKASQKAAEASEKHQASQEAGVDFVADMTTGVIAGTAYGVAAASLVAAPFTGGTSLIVTTLALSTAVGIGAVTKPIIKASNTLSGQRSYTLQNLKYHATTGGLAGLLAPVSAGTGSLVIKRVLGTSLGKQLGVTATEQIIGKTATAEGIVLFGGQLALKTTQSTAGQQVVKAGLWTGKEAIQGAVFGGVDAPTRHVLNGGKLEDIPQVALQGGVVGAILGPVVSGVTHGIGAAVGKTAKGIQSRFSPPKATVEAPLPAVEPMYKPGEGAFHADPVERIQHRANKAAAQVDQLPALIQQHQERLAFAREQLQKIETDIAQQGETPDRLTLQQTLQKSAAQQEQKIQSLQSLQALSPEFAKAKLKLQAIEAEYAQVQEPPGGISKLENEIQGRAGNMTSATVYGEQGAKKIRAYTDEQVQGYVVEASQKLKPYREAVEVARAQALQEYHAARQNHIQKISGLSDSEIATLAEKLGVHPDQVVESLEFYFAHHDTVPLDGEAGRIFHGYLDYKADQAAKLAQGSRAAKRSTQQLNQLLSKANLTSAEVEMMAGKLGVPPQEVIAVLEAQLNQGSGSLTGKLKSILGKVKTGALSEKPQQIYEAYLTLQANKQKTISLISQQGQSIFQELFPTGIRTAMQQNNKGHCFEISALDVLSQTPYGQEYGEAMIKNMIRVQKVGNTRKYIITFPEGTAPGVKQVEVYESEIGVPQAGKNPMTAAKGMQLLEKAIERSRKLALAPTEQTAVLADKGGSPGDVLALLTGKPKQSFKSGNYPEPYETGLQAADPQTQRTAQQKVQELEQRLRDMAVHPNNFLYVATAAKEIGVAERSPIFPGSPLLLFPEHAYAIRGVRIANAGTPAEQVFITLANPHNTGLQVQEIPLPLFLKRFNGISGVANVEEIGQQIRAQVEKPPSAYQTQPNLPFTKIPPSEPPIPKASGALPANPELTKPILQSTPEELTTRIQRRIDRALQQEQEGLAHPLTLTEQAQVTLKQLQKELTEIKDLNTRVFDHVEKMKQTGASKADQQAYLIQATQRLENYWTQLEALEEQTLATLKAAENTKTTSLNQAPDTDSTTLGPTAHDGGEPIEHYNETPLPFKSVNPEPEPLTWKDFDQDAENIYLYRGLDNMDRHVVQDIAHQSHAASFGEPLDTVYSRYGTADIVELSKTATNANQGASPILHTTRNKALANGLGSQGVTVTYKIPKRWLLQPENQPVLGNIGEQELNFLYALPPEFVHGIEQFGKDVDVITLASVTPQPHVHDVMDFSNGTLPPPPQEPVVIPGIAQPTPKIKLAVGDYALQEAPSGYREVGSKPLAKYQGPVSPETGTSIQEWPYFHIDTLDRPIETSKMMGCAALSIINPEKNLHYLAHFNSPKVSSRDIYQHLLKTVPFLEGSTIAILPGQEETTQQTVNAILKAINQFKDTIPTILGQVQFIHYPPETTTPMTNFKPVDLHVVSHDGSLFYAPPKGYFNNEPLFTPGGKWIFDE